MLSPTKNYAKLKVKSVYSTNLIFVNSDVSDKEQMEHRFPKVAVFQTVYKDDCS